MTNDERISLLSHLAAVLMPSVTTNVGDKTTIAVDFAARIVAAAEKKVADEQPKQTAATVPFSV